MAAWKLEFEKFKNSSEDAQVEYLIKLDDPDRFLELVETLNDSNCGFSTKINHVVPNQSFRIPDPMVVGKLERSLKRPLTEEELDEGHLFELNGETYQIPFVQFPEDM